VLLALMRHRLPNLVLRFERARPESSTGTALAELYEALPFSDFSRSVLAGLAGALRVVVVPHCGWMDVGTPERIARCLAECAPAGGATVSVESRHSLAPVFKGVATPTREAEPQRARPRPRRPAGPHFELR
jgi:hypothetical protein